MNISELRIGSILSAGVVTKIEGNSFEVFDGFQKWDSSKMIQQWIDEQPVLLSNVSQFLKLGLEEGNAGYYHKNGVIISVDNQIYFGESEVWIAEKNFVHEFQNLYFALVGEELVLQD